MASSRPTSNLGACILFEEAVAPTSRDTAKQMRTCSSFEDTSGLARRQDTWTGSSVVFVEKAGNTLAEVVLFVIFLLYIHAVQLFGPSPGNRPLGRLRTIRVFLLTFVLTKGSLDM